MTTDQHMLAWINQHERPENAFDCYVAMTKLVESNREFWETQTWTKVYMVAVLGVY